MAFPRIQWRNVATATAVSLALVTALWLFVPPLYLTNDDVTIRRGIEGHAFPGQPPTGFVLMTHSALGWTLVFLHRFVPLVPLWDLVLTGTLVWALGILFALVWPVLGSGWLPRATALSAMLAATLPLAGGVQFTISATLAGGAAVAAIVSELGSTTRIRASVCVMAAALMLTGLLIRPMGAAAGAMAVAVLLVPLAVGEKRMPQTYLRPATLTLGTVALLLGAMVYLDSALYSVSQQWDGYHRYNWMAAQLVEWGGDLPQTEVDVVRASAGWSANDWRMLQAAWAVDPDVHGIDRLSTAYEARAAVMTWEAWVRWLTARVTAIDWSFVPNVVFESAGLFAVIGVVLVAYGSRRAVAATALIVLLFFGLCVGIGIAFKDLPFRLLAPLQACLVASVLAAVGTLRRPASPLLSVVALSVALTMAAQETRMIAAAATADRRHTEQVQEEVAALRRLAPSLLILHSDAFPSEHWWRPFRAPAVDLEAIQLGMNDQNPLLQSYLTATGRQPLLRAVCADPSLLVIAEPNRLEFVTTYLREHFDIAARWTEAYSGSFRAWRCQPDSRHE